MNYLFLLFFLIIDDHSMFYVFIFRFLVISLTFGLLKLRSGELQKE